MSIFTLLGAYFCDEAPHSQFLEIQCKRVRRCSYSCNVMVLCGGDETDRTRCNNWNPFYNVVWSINSTLTFPSRVSQVVLYFHAHHNDIIFLRTENGYPLQIEVRALRYEESPINKDFLLNVLPKVNYPALRSAVKQISHHCEPPLPEIPENLDVSDTEGNKNLDDDGSSVLIDQMLKEQFPIMTVLNTRAHFQHNDVFCNKIELALNRTKNWQGLCRSHGLTFPFFWRTIEWIFKSGKQYFNNGITSEKFAHQNEMILKKLVSFTANYQLIDTHEIPIQLQELTFQKQIIYTTPTHGLLMHTIQ